MKTTTQIDFTADDIKTLPKTFEELVEGVTEQHNQALEMVCLCLNEMSNALLRNASYATDLPAPNGDESKKREIIDLWRGQADHLKVVSTAAWNSAVAPDRLRDELQGMLLNAVAIFYEERARDAERSQVAVARSEIENIMQERAGNIASAYMGRVLPE